MNPIIKENYITLLRTGAFKSNNREILPMSLYKWHILANIAKEHHVQSYLAEGIKILKESQSPDTPDLNDIGLSLSMKYDMSGTFDASKAYLTNSISKRRWEELREEEMNNIRNISDETLQLLDIIIMNADYIITSEVNIEGILSLGRFIRMNKDLIDYKKLNNWLMLTNMSMMANVQGSILTDVFELSLNEIQFMTKPYKNSRKLLMNSVEHTFKKQRTPLLTCLQLATLETLFNRFSGAISIVRDVEE